MSFPLLRGPQSPVQFQRELNRLDSAWGSGQVLEEGRGQRADFLSYGEEGDVRAPGNRVYRFLEIAFFL